MRILFVFACLIIFSCSRKQTIDYNLPYLIENTTHLQNESLNPFYHGVASGDPWQNSVVLWTRVTPSTTLEEIPVAWQVSTDKNFEDIIVKGKSTTSPAQDYTLKVIAEGLEPNTYYYYRFNAFGSSSIVGRTKTLPEDSEEIKLAFVSCSNIEFGYFNAYHALAIDDVDAVIHLGDYIYEYGPNVYGDTSFQRKNIPPHEIISLRDYRDRYSQYRLDPDLRLAHANHPFINIWDDHEITNNAHMTGAQNHQDDEGDYQTRKDVAKQVFYEWLPIRESKHHYRKFNFGQHADLIMLDERLAGRTMQPDSLNDPRRTDPSHSLLGTEQMEWLQSTLIASDASWKIIGNQVIFSYCDWGYDGFRLNLDAWDGYPLDQEKLSKTIKDNEIKNIIFVTGDTHTAWAFEATHDPLNNYNPETGEGAIGIELGVTSINSGNSNERSPDALVKKHEKKIANSNLNPHLKYVNMRDHGYLKLSLKAESVTAEYKIVKTLKTWDPTTRLDKKFRISNGKAKLISEH